jgi:Domain of unknown function (DUF4296)
MKKLLLPFLTIFILITSCNDAVVKAPENLIDENKMVDIIYDLSLLDAIKTQGSNQQSYPSTSEFLKKKYNVDSITFANNSKYYASDIKNYKKMYDRVKDRLNQENAKLNGGKVPQQSEEQGVVK